MEQLKERGRELRQNIRIGDTCNFKYHAIEDDIVLTKAQLANIFFGGDKEAYCHLCEQFYDIDRSLELNVEQKPIQSALQRKFKLLLDSMYPEVFTSLTRINLSGGGLGFNGNTLIDTMNSKAYVMLILDSYPVPMFLKGNFVYCMPVKDHAFSYRVGFKFDAIFNEEKSIIEKHIEAKKSIASL